MSRLLSDRTAEDGTFEIASVPPGLYMLEVRQNGARRNRGGRGNNGSTLHAQQISVVATATTPVHVDYSTSEVEFVLDLPPGISGDRITVTVIEASRAAGIEPDQWQRAEGASRLRARNGSTERTPMTPGSYRYTVRGRDIAPQNGAFELSGGAEASIRVSLSPPQDK